MFEKIGMGVVGIFAFATVAVITSWVWNLVAEILARRKVLIKDDGPPNPTISFESHFVAPDPALSQLQVHHFINSWLTNLVQKKEEDGWNCFHVERLKYSEPPEEVHYRLGFKLYD